MGAWLIMNLVTLAIFFFSQVSVAVDSNSKNNIILFSLLRVTKFWYDS